MNTTSRNSGLATPYVSEVVSGFKRVVVTAKGASKPPCVSCLPTGFLPAMDGASRANNGLLDQIAALHWIQENIDVFGGDPRNVTIAGHGHGAACVNFLMMSPMAKGTSSPSMTSAIPITARHQSSYSFKRYGYSISYYLCCNIDVPDTTGRVVILLLIF